MRKMFNFMLSAWIAFCIVPACAAKDIYPNWKADCVGRMALRFPGDVDVAAIALKDWGAPRGVGGEIKYSFPDGQTAGWSSLNFYGRIFITHGLSNGEILTMHQEIETGRNKVKNYSKTQHKNNPGFHEFNDVSVSPQNGFGWDVGDRRDVQLFIENNYFSWRTGVYPEEKFQLNKYFEIIRSGLFYRPLLTNPKQDGLCLPYAFIRDEGKSDRDIAMTYRLKVHPDVTIWLKDSSASEYSEPNRSKNAQPEYLINDFWNQYGYSKTGKKVDTIWKTPATRSVKLDGQNGLASFVQITRKDNSIDYGYFAAVRGDPKAKQDTPDLQLYIIREAAHAKAKGIEPIGEDEFLEMAQAIAASIKHRAEYK